MNIIKSLSERPGDAGFYQKIAVDVSTYAVVYLGHFKWGLLQLSLKNDFYNIEL